MSRCVSNFNCKIIYGKSYLTRAIYFFQPTVHPINDFQPTEDAQQLKQAFKGFGCDEDTIIGIITSRTNEQRQIIATEFKTMFGKVKN